MTDCDVCVIGSGAGGGPVALSLAQAGRSVIVLEKGPWLDEGDFCKDELAVARRAAYTPSPRDEAQVIEQHSAAGGWQSRSTVEAPEWSLWNGNCVGGATNFMSGFFYRLKPEDFRLRTEFGPIEGAQVVDWPLDYADLEPWYALVEREVGISGRVEEHPRQEPRSTPDFPYPPTAEHPLAGRIDATCRALGLHPLRIPRAILPHAVGARRGCEYSGYCGSHGCATGAKGSSRTALLVRAVATGRCAIRARAQVRRLVSDARGRVQEVEYSAADGSVQRVTAKLFVVACNAIESARLLLLSSGPRHPRGLGNRSGQVGRNLLFSAGGAGGAAFPYARFAAELPGLARIGPFVNRGLQDWYAIDDPAFGPRSKGGTIDFLLQHPDPIGRAEALTRDGDGRLRWGLPLQRAFEEHFRDAQHLRFEIFCDWLPVDDCFVALDPQHRDRWGLPVARVRVGPHPHNLRVGRFLAERALEVMRALGGERVFGGADAAPAVNLVAGGCRFGRDPASSVLDPDCRVHDAENVFVSDGSFLPTGGSVPYTWTIYANAFRVAERIEAQL